MMSSHQKKKGEWIASSFGDFASSQSSKIKKPLKRKNEERFLEQPKLAPSGASDFSKVSSASLPWAEKYSPVTENDLAVHKKKIAEVKDWVLTNLTSTNKKSGSNILVLTGPAGVGKSATIDVLRRDLNIEMQEWNTPVTNTNEEYSSWKEFRILSTDSQRKQFQDFLLRANKYPTLSICGQESTAPVPGKKIVLVEDIPNVFYRNVKDFHEVLRKFRATSRNPLVFIISDSYVGESSLYSLFPKRIQLELSISCISFNAIANTSLMKAVTKIINAVSQMKSKNFKTPTKDMLDLLISSSNGDIRACINSLQFYCTNEYISKKRSSSSTVASNKSKSVTKTKSKQKVSDESRTVLFGRDTSLFLFKALGKILYCKREHVNEAEKSKELPTHLRKQRRDKLLIDPEEIVEKTHIQHDTFNLYLHQNYLGFYNDINDVSNASQFFSDADVITGLWSTRDVLRSYSSSVATRGVVFSNCHRFNSSTGSVSGGWRPLHKPQWFEAFKEENSNRRTAEDLFCDMRHPSVDLHSDVLPYISKTNIPLRTPSHIAFVQMISRFNINIICSSSTLGQHENEADAIGIEEGKTEKSSSSKQSEDGCVSLSQVLLETQQSNEDIDSYEENLIEDFSDEDDFEDLLLI